VGGEGNGNQKSVQANLAQTFRSAVWHVSNPASVRVHGLPIWKLAKQQVGNLRLHKINSRRAGSRGG